MNAKRMLLAFGAAVAAAGLVSVPSAYAGYPIKCQNNKVVVIDDATGAESGPFSTIQAGVNAAKGSTMGTFDDPAATGSSGDTVLVCKGTFKENVTVGILGVDAVAPDTTANDNITIRSFDDTNAAVVTAADPTKPIFTITAPGVTLGGPGLGLTITGPMTTAVQVGTPGVFNDDDDDQEVEECITAADLPPDPEEIGQCPDEELDPFRTTNVAIVGNRIKSATTSTSFTGIAVNNTNNTMTFRNLISGATVGAGQRAAGIVYADTNYNSHVLGNEITNLTQTGTTCGGSSLTNPTVGVVGVSFEEEALDALVYDTKIDRLTGGCAAVGVYSSAWGRLENDRNGQQVPVAVDAVDNRIKDVVGAAGATAGIALAPVHPAQWENDDPEESGPSSFRIMANDIDHTHTAVAVLSPLAAYSYIRENDLDAQVNGVYSTSASTVDATNNWWGCQNGPRTSAPSNPNPLSVGKKECAAIAGTGVVTYNPWTKHHIDHAGAHAGEYAGHN